VYASALIHAGASVKVVQARLGHATAAETLDTYSHIWPDSDGHSRDAIDNLFANEQLQSNQGDTETPTGQ
jgi:site-specific recombinase XerD